ncbi:MAG TPA: DEAD/DEAH box helicase, partial [Candidatus Dormibacteraeota bacterium]|nr:DEAD/DEAH box helicase [Candidatus Dormibacteraeota bacterium]
QGSGGTAGARSSGAFRAGSPARRDAGQSSGLVRRPASGDADLSGHPGPDLYRRSCAGGSGAHADSA